MISDEYKLYEEGFHIYRKFKKYEKAINVLLYNINDIYRGLEFAKYCKDEKIWGILGKVQLSRGMIVESIDSFIKANNPYYYEQIIKIAENQNQWKILIE